MTEIDTTQVGVAASEMMEKLGEDYPEGSRVRDVMVIVSIEVPDPSHEPNERMGETGDVEVIDWWCTNERRIVQVGLLTTATNLFSGEWTKGDEE